DGGGPAGGVWGVAEAGVGFLVWGPAGPWFEKLPGAGGVSGRPRVGLASRGRVERWWSLSWSAWPPLPAATLSATSVAAVLVVALVWPRRRTSRRSGIAFRATAIWSAVSRSLRASVRLARKRSVSTA